MVFDQTERQDNKTQALARLQFVAEVSLIASRSRKDDRIALEIMLILINSVLDPDQEDDFYYEAK